MQTEKEEPPGLTGGKGCLARGHDNQSQGHVIFSEKDDQGWFSEPEVSA